MSHSILGKRPGEILMVEDNEGDVLLAREGFKRVSFPVHLHHVPNGEECLAYLRKEGNYADATSPDLILLDLNMPVMGGREVMAELAHDPQLCHLPVVVLTTSADKQDIAQMYSLRCSTYIVKPLDFEEFQRIIQIIGEYWFTVAALPDGIV